MEIGAFNSQSGCLLQFETLPEKDQDGEGLPEDLVPNTEAPQPSPTPPKPADQEAAVGEDGKGVIRNLQQGHFKGVADVRLRINFHDELAAIEQGQFQAIAEEKIGGVLESVEASVTTLLESGELTEEQYGAVEEFKKAFVQAVNQSKDEFMAADGPSNDTLVGKLESAFDELVEPLSVALSTTATEEPEEAPVPEDDVIEETGPVSPAGEEQDSALKLAPTSEPKPNFHTFLEDLRSAFITALNEVASGLNETSALPELSEPNGNGAAYDKFLAIYNELWGVETSDVAPTSGESLDTIA